ncbi:hypothetical protein [Oceanobacillus jeddahense]|uniref:hypothetical protein n=1 Tax=Oceanobacillus jeddahense TaxID=1462527 RepID=UPI0005961C9A|nr:hypothetical protein [Oceanobacillus jeddahense]
MKKRIYFLDHLRIFTITMVIVYHVTLLYTNAFEYVQNPVRPTIYDYDVSDKWTYAKFDHVFYCGIFCYRFV